MRRIILSSLLLASASTASAAPETQRFEGYVESIETATFEGTTYRAVFAIQPWAVRGRQPTDYDEGWTNMRSGRLWLQTAKNGGRFETREIELPFRQFGSRARNNFQVFDLRFGRDVLTISGFYAGYDEMYPSNSYSNRQELPFVCTLGLGPDTKLQCQKATTPDDAVNACSRLTASDDLREQCLSITKPEDGPAMWDVYTCSGEHDDEDGRLRCYRELRSKKSTPWADRLRTAAAIPEYAGSEEYQLLPPLSLVTKLDPTVRKLARVSTDAASVTSVAGRDRRGWYLKIGGRVNGKKLTKTLRALGGMELGTVDAIEGLYDPGYGVDALEIDLVNDGQRTRCRYDLQTRDAVCR